MTPKKITPIGGSAFDWRSNASGASGGTSTSGGSANARRIARPIGQANAKKIKRPIKTNAKPASQRAKRSSK